MSFRFCGSGGGGRENKRKKMVFALNIIPRSLKCRMRASSSCGGSVVRCHYIGSSSSPWHTMRPALSESMFYHARDAIKWRFFMGNNIRSSFSLIRRYAACLGITQRHRNDTISTHIKITMHTTSNFTHLICKCANAQCANYVRQFGNNIFFFFMALCMFALLLFVLVVFIRHIYSTHCVLSACCAGCLLLMN